MHELWPLSNPLMKDLTSQLLITALRIYRSQLDTHLVRSERTVTIQFLQQSEWLVCAAAVAPK